MNLKIFLVFFVVCWCSLVFAKPASKPSDDGIHARSSCQLPMVKGVCRALMRRWGYDPTSKDCVKFEYGGCQGNGNNFNSRQECMEACKGA